MASIISSRTRERDMHAPDHGSQHWSQFQLPRPPRITYSKKDTKLLPLTASRFRPDIYAIPPDDEDQVPVRRYQAVLPASGPDIPSDDLRPSHGEPPPLNSSAKDKRRVTTSRRAQRESKHSVNHAASKSLRGSARDRDGRPRSARRTGGKSAHSAGARRQEDVTNHDRHRISKRQQTTGTGRRTISVKRASTPKRRLPVNELILVHSPLHVSEPPVSPAYLVPDRTQDPIEDRASSARQCSSPYSSPEDRRAQLKPVETPLSVIRKRLRPSKHYQKSMRPARKSATELRTIVSNDFQQRGRDGFEDSELTVRPQRKKKKKTIIAKEGLIFGLERLQLDNGPLPDVKFEQSATELKMEKSPPPPPAHVTEQLDEGYVPINGSDSVSEHHDIAKKRAKDQQIRAELSSISAPERPPSESEDSGEEGDAESLDENVDDRLDTDSELLDIFNQPVIPSSIQVVDKPLAQHSDRSFHQEQVEEAKKENVGVTLDFRLPSVPGQLPKQPLGKRHLIEVKDPIIEVREAEMPPTDELFYTDRTDRASRFNPTLLSHQRHRSILKNSAPARPTHTTRRESTAANTRRNTLVHASESRYFADASDMLDGPNRPVHKIIPRRPSCFARSEIEVPDSGRIVPETSSAHIDHLNRGALRNVQQDFIQSGSPELPTGSRHFQTLTSAVRMEEGTMAQSSRRKPSFLFQAPTRVI